MRALLIGIVYVVVGLAIFRLGLNLSVIPVGSAMAERLAEPGASAGTAGISAWLSYGPVYAFAAAIGFAATLVEPTLIMVADRVRDLTGGGVPAVPRSVVALAYDTGPMATSIVTVPLVTSLGVGLAAAVPGRTPLADGFGLVVLALLATGAIILPLRHPLRTAKAAASVDQLTGGRLVLGVALGDRPAEFPAFGVDWQRRDVLFRENLAVLRTALAEEFSRLESSYGVLPGTVVPKPVGQLPVLITGSSRQSLEWIAAHADGWITYPRPLAQQAEITARWRALVAEAAPGAFKPLAQSLYVDLTADPDYPPQPIHLGFHGGRDVMIRFLEELRAAGVHHVAFNFKYARRSTAELLDEIGPEVLPRVESSQSAAGAHAA
jgi:luciferase-type oxidoreductase